MQPPPSQLTTRVVYDPPPDSLINAYAERVCQALGSGYDDPEVVDGLAGFLKAVAKAYANILTRQEGRPN